MAAMTSEPRLAGLRNPSAEKMMVTMAMKDTWAPTPVMTAKARGAVEGGRNTSVWTSFQPDSSRSSAFSSSVATRL